MTIVNINNTDCISQKPSIIDNYYKAKQNFEQNISSEAQQNSKDNVWRLFQ